MARDAVPQAQELPQERFLDRAEQRHVRAILAAGQYGAERDQQQFMQIMAVLPGGNDLGKAGDEFFHGRASTLNPRLESSHTSPSNPRLQPPAPYAIVLVDGALGIVRRSSPGLFYRRALPDKPSVWQMSAQTSPPPKRQ